MAASERNDAYAPVRTPPVRTFHPTPSNYAPTLFPTHVPAFRRTVEPPTLVHTSLPRTLPSLARMLPRTYLCYVPAV
eukprot:6194757-Pleurochrysis_carterae.AAC.1